MRGSSRSARDAALRAFDPVASAAGKAGTVLAAELFAVVDALDGSASLRRALTDPARPGQDKAALVAELFGSLDARTVDVVSDLARGRWSAEADLADSVEQAGELALIAAAEAAGDLGAVEDQLFRIERELMGHRELLSALGDRTIAAAERGAIFTEIFGSKVHAITAALVLRKVSQPRGKRVLTSLRELVQTAADRRQRLVARVTAAVELSAEQRSRLIGILERTYDAPVQLNVAVDPAVLGGIKVQVGSEVVDGTIISRLADARRRLVG